MVDVSGTRSCQFGPLVVTYDERVLEPRLWTLGQSEWAAQLCQSAPPGPLLELCAGAGHIGLAAAVLADRDLVQVEADPTAAGFARANADTAGWGERVEIRTERLQTAIRANESFAVILADPPYLPSSTIDRWPDDPPMAIDGGPDGLDLIRACLQVGADHLIRGGRMLLQIAGPAQADLVTDLAAEVGLTPGEVRVTDTERAVLRLDLN